MNSKFIIKVGDRHYGSGFHVNSRTINNWPNSFLTTDINEARVFNNMVTAKAMATRIRSVLVEWIKVTPDCSYYEWEPICVIEIAQIVGPIRDTKPFITEDI